MLAPSCVETAFGSFILEGCEAEQCWVAGGTQVELILFSLVALVYVPLVIRSASWWEQLQVGATRRGRGGLLLAFFFV